MGGQEKLKEAEERSTSPRKKAAAKARKNPWGLSTAGSAGVDTEVGTAEFPALDSPSAAAAAAAKDGQAEAGGADAGITAKGKGRGKGKGKGKAADVAEEGEGAEMAFEDGGEDE